MRNNALQRFEALFFLGLIGLNACATTPETGFDRDPEVNFSRFHSYAWISNEPLIQPQPGIGKVSPFINPLDDKRIRAAVDESFKAKGLHQVDTPEQADLVVSYTVGTETKTRVFSSPTFYPSRFGYVYGGWYGGSDLQTVEYTEGSLAIELFEAKNRQAVWVGWASRRLNRGSQPPARIRTTVDAILANFPPPPTNPSAP